VAVSTTLRFPILGAKQLREMRKFLHSVLSWLTMIAPHSSVTFQPAEIKSLMRRLSQEPTAFGRTLALSNDYAHIVQFDLRSKIEASHE
jgi:hypothetical protein